MLKKCYALPFWASLFFTSSGAMAIDIAPKIEMSIDKTKSKIDVSYIYDNDLDPKYIYLVFDNKSSKNLEFKFEVMLNNETILNSVNDFTVKSGETLIGSDMTIAIPFSKSIDLNNLTTNIIYKK